MVDKLAYTNSIDANALIVQTLRSSYGVIISRGLSPIREQDDDLLYIGPSSVSRVEHFLFCEFESQIDPCPVTDVLHLLDCPSKSCWSVVVGEVGLDPGVLRPT